jgi:hypothetical protein
MVSAQMVDTPSARTRKENTMSRSAIFSLVLFAVAAFTATAASAAGYQVGGYEVPTVSSNYAQPGYGEVQRVRPRVVWHRREVYTHVSYTARRDLPCE